MQTVTEKGKCGDVRRLVRVFRREDLFAHGNPNPPGTLSFEWVERMAVRIFDIDPWIPYAYDGQLGASYMCVFCGAVALYEQCNNEYRSPHKSGCVYRDAREFLEKCDGGRDADRD